MITTIGNILTLKECNWIKCRRKDVRLKRCKKCLSVYYCSKRCQKTDWILSHAIIVNGKRFDSTPHRQQCKELRKRDLSLTLINGFF